MTGEDMIIEAATKLLKSTNSNEHAELRRVFWIAGRCESCGVPHNGDSICESCKCVIVNRVEAPPERVLGIQWYTLTVPASTGGGTYDVLVVNGFIAVSGAIGHFGEPWEVCAKTFREWGWTVTPKELP